MIGAIIGDIVGSRFEWHNRKTKDFELFVTGDASARKAAKGYAEAKAAYEAAKKAESSMKCWPFGKRGKRLGLILAESGSLLSSSIKVDADAPKHPFCRTDRACHYTDDTVMTLAIAAALMDWKTGGGDLGAFAVVRMQEFGRRFPHAGYGGHFHHWIHDDDPRPYNSWGNGAAMRVSACGWAGRTLDEVKAMSRAVTEVTHNHPEGIKGAEATAVATFLARTGKSMKEIRQYVLENYYKIDFTLDEIRPTYEFDVSCQGSVPQALEAFFESTSFEDAIRNAISVGGDSDTIGAICGAVAGAFYGVSDDIRAKALSFLDSALIDTLTRFEHLYTTPVGADDSAEVSRRKSDEKVLRFLEAQEGVYPAALREVTEGKKRGHWMWYVFPQLKGLGHSAMSERYGISDLSEARAYLRHPVLGRRLKDIASALLTHKGRSAEEIFGRVDAMKLRSSMTLFNMVEYDSVFKNVLDTFYCSKPDGVTVDIVLAMARANPENMAHRVFANETYRIAAWHALGIQSEVTLDDLFKE